MAIKAPPVDPLEQQIQQAQAAIIQVKDSADPAYIAAPHKRIDLIEQLQERIAHLQQVKAERDQAAADRAHREQLAKAWQALGPKRQAFAERWNALRTEMREVLTAAQTLDAEHLAKGGKRAFSETVAPISLLSACCEVLAVDDGLSPVLVRPEDL